MSEETPLASPYRERVLQLIEDIGSRPERFDMCSFVTLTDTDSSTFEADPRWSTPYRKFVESCGTSMCIAGWAVARAMPEATPAEENYDFEVVATEWLGLRQEQSRDLFYNYAFTADDAIRVLRKYIETSQIPSVNSPLQSPS